MFKKILYTVIGIIVIGLFVTGGILYYNNKILKQELKLSTSREKAYIAEQDSLVSQSNLFQFTIEQLSYYQDSLNQKLLEKSRELKLKESKIKQMQYLLTESTKIDTIITTDTLFREDVSLDTTLTSKYYTLNVKLEYPNYIEITPKFIDELFIFITSKKETINPPNPCFFIRWFQRKHIVQVIDIENSNPYIKFKKTRFIEIVQLKK